MSGPRRSPESIRKMADLLRSGAAMLAERCPLCGLPLFRLRSGEVVCPEHGRVYIVRDETEYVQATVQGVLERLERAVAERLGRVVEMMARGEFADEDAKLVSGWLDVLERVERILAMIRRSREAREARRPEGERGS